MRVVLYAAGAYVLSTVALAAAPSTNLAFVAKPASSENRIFHPLASHQPYMSKHIRKGLGSYVMMQTNHEDPADVMTRVDAMMSRTNNKHSGAGQVETSDNNSDMSLHSSPARNVYKESSERSGYTPPVGYAPQRTTSLHSTHNEAVVHRVIEMLNSENGTSKLEHSWTAPTGYLERLEQRLMGEVENMRKSSEMTSAPAKTWQPYGGYEPKRDRPATPAPAAPLSSAPAPTAQMTSGIYRERET